MTRTESLFARDIIKASQSQGFCTGHYGWWCDQALRKKLASMVTGHGTIISNREFRRILQQMDDKKLIIRCMPAPGERWMIVTQSCVRELIDRGYGDDLDDFKRRRFHLPKGCRRVGSVYLPDGREIPAESAELPRIG